MKAGSVNGHPIQGVFMGSTDTRHIDSDSELFPQIYRETEIRAEIALKVAKLPNPNVWVDPRAITKMATNEKFYNKVMNKINEFTSNPNIPLHYPDIITYSLVIYEDGEWTETMVDERLKKLNEEAAAKDATGKGKKTSIFDMLDTSSALPVEQQNNSDVYSSLDYTYAMSNHALFDIRRKIERKNVILAPESSTE